MTQHTVYSPGGYDPAKPYGNAVEQWDDTARTVTDFRAGQAVTRPYTTAENAAADAAAVSAAQNAARAQLLSDIVTKAIGWLETDAAQASARATAIGNAIGTATTRKGQAEAFTFSGATVSGINTQLNTALKPLLVDMLTYTIGLAGIVQGIEEWRGQRVDPSLVWLARHGTDTTD